MPKAKTTSLLAHAWHTPLTHHMGNSKFEHIVATVHEMNGETVTADTQLEAFDRALEQESTSRRRAFDFNNDALSRVFPEFFEFLEELEPLSSQDSTATFFSFPDTSDESQG